MYTFVNLIYGSIINFKVVVHIFLTLLYTLPRLLSYSSIYIVYVYTLLLYCDRITDDQFQGFFIIIYNQNI